MMDGLFLLFLEVTSLVYVHDLEFWLPAFISVILVDLVLFYAWYMEGY
jgi:hypothetical protein